MAGSQLIRTNTSKFASAAPGVTALGGILGDSANRLMTEMNNVECGKSCSG
jgi:hypothetical protein